MQGSTQGCFMGNAGLFCTNIPKCSLDVGSDMRYDIAWTAEKVTIVKYMTGLQHCDFLRVPVCDLGWMFWWLVENMYTVRAFWNVIVPRIIAFKRPELQPFDLILRSTVRSLFPHSIPATFSLTWNGIVNRPTALNPVCSQFSPKWLIKSTNQCCLGQKWKS